MTATALPLPSLIHAVRAIADAAKDLNPNGRPNPADLRLTVADHLPVVVQLATAVGRVGGVLAWQAVAVPTRYNIVGARIRNQAWGADRGWLAKQSIRSAHTQTTSAARLLNGSASALRRQIRRLAQANAPQALKTAGTSARLATATAFADSFQAFDATLANSHGGAGAGYVLQSHVPIAGHVYSILVQLSGALLRERSLLGVAFEGLSSPGAADVCGPLLDARRAIILARRPYQLFVGDLAHDAEHARPDG